MPSLIKSKAMLVLQASMFTAVGAITPATAMLAASGTVMTERNVILMILLCFVGGMTALKAFLSTTYSDSQIP